MQVCKVFVIIWNTDYCGVQCQHSEVWTSNIFLLVIIVTITSYEYESLVLGSWDWEAFA